MAVEHERQLEDELCGHLGAHGWVYEPGSTGYDKKRALWSDDLFAWLEATQPETLAAIVKTDRTGSDCWTGLPSRWTVPWTRAEGPWPRCAMGSSSPSNWTCASSVRLSR